MTTLTIAPFLLNRAPGCPSRVSRSNLWRQYQEWAERAGMGRPMTRNKFYDAVREMGATDVISGGVRQFLIPEPDVSLCRVCAAPFKSYDSEQPECGPQMCREWANAGPVGFLP